MEPQASCGYPVTVLNELSKMTMDIMTLKIQNFSSILQNVFMKHLSELHLKVGTTAQWKQGSKE
jgi:hypothetical protein